MELHRIAVVVEASSRGVAPGLAAGLAAITNFERSAVGSLSKVRTAFASLPTSVKALGGLTVGIGLLATGLKAVLGPAIEFESAFAGVLKTVDGTPNQMARIRQSLLDLSTVMPTTAAELAGIAENAGALGVSAGEVVNFTEVIAQLGETTDLDFDSAAKSMARFLTVSGAGIDQIGPVSDALVELGNNSAATESEILELALRAASAGRQIGLTADQTLAYAAGLRSTGILAEAGGSAFSRILIAIRDASVDAGAELDIFARTSGVLPETFQQIVANNPTEAIDLFVRGLAKITAEGGSTTGILDQLNLEGIRVGQVIRVMSDNADFFASRLALASAAAAAGEARITEYGRRVETTAAQIDILSNRVRGLAIDVGTPFLAGVVVTLNAMGDAIESVANQLRPLGSEILTLFRSMADGAGDFYDVIGSPILAGASGGLGLLATALADIVGLLNALGPAGIAVTALAADIALVGPVSIAANRALTSMGISIAGVTTFANGSVAATTSMSAAFRGLLASINPVAAGTALLVAGYLNLRRGLRDVEQQAQESARVLRTSLDEGLDSGSLVDFNANLIDSRARLVQLQEQWDNLSFSDRNFPSFDFFDLTDEDEKVAAIRAEIEALSDALEDDAIEQYDWKLGLLSQKFDLTEAQILEMVESLGLNNLLVSEGADGYRKLFDALATTTVAAQQYAGVQDELALRLASGAASANEFLDAINATEGQLNSLVAFFPGLDAALEDVFSDDDNERAFGFSQTVQILEGDLADLAEAAGLSNEAFREQFGLLGDLASKYDEVGAAISETERVLNAVWEQEQQVAEAGQAVAQSLQAIQDASDLTAAAESQRGYSLALAGSGAELTRIEAEQRAFEDALREAGIQAGISSAAIEEAILKSRVPETHILAVARLGDEWAAQRVEILESLGLVTSEITEMTIAAELWANGEYRASLEADGTLGEEEIDRMVGEANAWALADASITPGAFTAPLDADPVPALEAIDQAVAAGNDYAAADYLSFLTSDPSNALENTAAAQSAANTYSDGSPYGAALTAATAAAAAGISGVTGLANTYANGSPYSSTISARTSQAQSALQGIVNLISRIKSKTVTINTRYTSTGGGGGSTQFAMGGIAVAQYANGGVNLAGAPGPAPNPMQSIPERVGTAQVYRQAPAGRVRVHSEWYAGDEAYIPLNPRTPAGRDRALAITEVARRRLGATQFASGGVTASQIPIPTTSLGGSGGQITISAPVSLSIDTRGGRADPGEITRYVEQAVNRALDRAGREFGNRRLR